MRPPPGVQPFANVVVVLPEQFPAAGVVDLAHEVGHAMFALADEYVGEVLGYDGREDLSSWPTCAEDREEAEAWWGDVIGGVDPMMDIWHGEMAQAGFPLQDPDTWRVAIAVGLVDGGCYGVAGSYRATADSLMNSSIPVMGTQNRRWAEQVLELWAG